MSQTIKENEHNIEPSTIDNPRLINILNDDCLYKIFTYLDLKELAPITEVSRKFQAIACKVFVAHHQRRIVLPVRSEFEVKLDTTDAVLRQFGPHTIDLAVTFPIETEPRLDLDIYADLRTIAINYICRFVSHNLEKLRMENLQVFDLLAGTINQMKPILFGLKVLKLSAWDRETTPCFVDFRVLCPVLEKLKLAGDFILDDAECSNLENLTIHRNRLLQSDASEDMLPRFYSCNQNLKHIKIKDMNYSQALSELETANLKVIEKLSIECYSLPARDLRILAQMTSLTNLSLSGINTSDNLEEVLTILSHLSTLKILKLGMTSSKSPKIDEISLAVVGEKLNNLEVFHISKCELTSKGIVKFLKKAERLRVFSIRGTNVHPDYDLILRAFEVRQDLGAGIGALELHVDFVTPEMDEDIMEVKKIHFVL